MSKLNNRKKQNQNYYKVILINNQQLKKNVFNETNLMNKNTFSNLTPNLTLHKKLTIFSGYCNL